MYHCQICNTLIDPKSFHVLSVVGLMISSFICLSKWPTCKEGLSSLWATLPFFVLSLHTHLYACGGNLRGATCSSEAVNLHASVLTLSNFNKHSYINLNAFHVECFSSLHQSKKNKKYKKHFKVIKPFFWTLECLKKIINRQSCLN